MIAFLRKNSKKEIFRQVIAPFFYSRFLLLIVAWFSQYFQASNQYFSTNSSNSQFAFSSFRFLDVWGRWDSGWYLKIAQQGYLLSNIGNNQGNSFAFFPLYPSLIKLFSLIVPEKFLSQEVWLFLAAGLANLFFLFGLIIFYYLVKNTFTDLLKSGKEVESIASKSVIFLLLFPTVSSFQLLTVNHFFSCWQLVVSP